MDGVNEIAFVTEKAVGVLVDSFKRVGEYRFAAWRNSHLHKFNY